MGELEVGAWFSGRSVLVTGATGFVGGVLLEKLLRECPRLAAAHLLVRPGAQETAEQRVARLLDSPLFSQLEGDEWRQRVFAVPGDVSRPQLGLQLPEEAAARLLDEVSVVFHCAASTSLAAGLRRTVTANLDSTQHLLDLCKRMPNLQVLVHMSTAFCNCVVRDAVAERVYPTSLPPERVLELVHGLTDAELEAATPSLVGGHPSAYTFSKQLAENLLVEHRPPGLRLVIVRPSIVCGAAREPVAGWSGGAVGDGSSAGAFLVGAAHGVFRVAAADPRRFVDFVPCDVVAALAVAAAAHAEEGVQVYHATSGDRRPLRWGEYAALVQRACRRAPSRRLAAPPTTYCRAWPPTAALTFLITHLLPALLLNALRCDRGLLQAQRKYWRAMWRARFFSCRDWRFRTGAADRLRARMSPADLRRFAVDVDSAGVDWERLFSDSALAVRRYALREDPATIPAARARMRRLEVTFWLVALCIASVPLLLCTDIVVGAICSVLVITFLLWL
ncbi:putative fatty acyl-CoA reductase CG5065 [Schistocerca gregaria]|uniref:putative fatty acyl-CoA reductase CG5065 n=1 Tax=Schistocerca gregaria TaxID=7010 RepID=UPI00211EF936|nr:putative fatty acyl-CoA reductase CG5065 [Schistocerca gregaria]